MTGDTSTAIIGRLSVVWVGVGREWRDRTNTMLKLELLWKR